MLGLLGVRDGLLNGLRARQVHRPPIVTVARVPASKSPRKTGMVPVSSAERTVSGNSAPRVQGYPMIGPTKRSGQDALADGLHGEVSPELRAYGPLSADASAQRRSRITGLTKSDRRESRWLEVNVGGEHVGLSGRADVGSDNEPIRGSAPHRPWYESIG